MKTMSLKEYRKGFWGEFVSVVVLGAAIPVIEGQVISISPAGVTASSEIPSPFNRLDDYLVNGSGLTAGGTHGTAVQPNMWLSRGIGFGGEDLDPSVTFDLGAIHVIRSIRVWNYNEAPPNLTNRGVNAVTVEYGTTNALGEVVPGISSFTQANGLGTYAGEVFDSFTPFQARYIKFDIDSNHGDASNFYGLSEVQFDGEPIVVTSSERNFASSKVQGDVIALLETQPVTAGETYTYTLVAGDGDVDNSKFQIVGDELQIGNHDFSGSPDGTGFSIRILSTATSSGLQIETVIPLQAFIDSDLDDLFDFWEERWAPEDLFALSGLGGANADGDGLTDLEEFNLREAFPNLSPRESDSDDDGLDDDDELAGAGLRPPTDPTRGDTDDDGLTDLVESNTTTFIDEFNTGSNPTVADTDNDRFEDGLEVTRGSDPNNFDSIPKPLLVGYWDFEGDLDPQPDRSEFSNDASVIQGATWVLDPERGGVMEFDGNDSYLEAADSESLSIEGDITIAAWIRVTDYNGFRGIVGKTAGPLGNQPAPYDLYLHQTNGRPRFFSGSATSSARVDGLTPPVIEEWHHVAVTRIGNEIAVYYDGQIDSVGTIMQTPQDAGTPLRIGNRSDLNTDFLGRLDDVAIFDGGLEPGEIMQIMQGDFSDFGGGGGEPLQLMISQEESGLRFEWDTRNGKVYDLVSSVDLMSSPATWEVYQDNPLYRDIAGVDGILSLTNVPLDGTARFFAIIERKP